MAGKKKRESRVLADLLDAFGAAVLQLDRVTRFSLWLHLPRIWERRAAETMRGVAFAGGGDPGEHFYESLEIIAGQGEKRHWEATKARAMAEAMAQVAAMRGG